jgi:hypothetical protein
MGRTVYKYFPTVLYGALDVDEGDDAAEPSLAL